MTEEQAFLKAICSDPADDAVRLAFADWLEDHGQRERAEFIRVQMELEIVECGYCRPIFPCRAGGLCPKEPLRRRERELLRLHVQGWIPPIEGLAIWTCFQVNVKPKFGWVFRRAHHPGEELLVEFRRGFPEQVTCRLGDWIGEECQRCSSRGWVADDYRVTGKHQSTCFPCHGTGCINAHGPAIVQTCPVREVATEKRPRRNEVAGFCRWFMETVTDQPDSDTVPQCIFDHISGGTEHPWIFATDTAARAALSDALIAWARAKAGLPVKTGV